MLEQFLDTKRMPFMLDKTRKPLFPIFEKKIGILLLENVAKNNHFEKSHKAEN